MTWLADGGGKRWCIFCQRLHPKADVAMRDAWRGICRECAEIALWTIEQQQPVAAVEQVPRERDDADALREIIVGRTTAPTDAEIEAHAHAKAAGTWLHADAEDGAVTLCQDAWSARLVRHRAGRWWALGPDGAPCAWPVVTEVTP